MKIKKMTLRDEFDKMTIEQLSNEEAKLRSLLHEQFDLMLDGMGDVKGYKNQQHLTVKKDMEKNWNVYRKCREVLSEKHARNRIWNDDCEGGKLISQEEWNKLVEDGKAVSYVNNKKEK